jgi:hypothetical protein
MMGSSKRSQTTSGNLLYFLTGPNGAGKPRFAFLGPLSAAPAFLVSGSGPPPPLRQARAQTSGPWQLPAPT